LHLFNAVAERGGSLLLTATTAPAYWNTVLPDLRSRLKALPVAILAMPDDALFKAVLAKLFTDRRLQISPEVIEFLTLRLERSF
ncbi:DnaA/Hda family protein, partial [Acinetobacter baumannii]